MAISAAAGTVICLFGFEQGVFGGIIVGHEFQEYFRRPSLSPTGFVTSIYDLGCFAGALAALLVGEWLGQKRMLIDFTFIMAIVILIQTSASSINHFLWGRFIAGIGNGGNTATAPVWHVETSHQSAKGCGQGDGGQCARLCRVEYHHSSLQRPHYQGLRGGFSSAFNLFSFLLPLPCNLCCLSRHDSYLLEEEK